MLDTACRRGGNSKFNWSVQVLTQIITSGGTFNDIFDNGARTSAFPAEPYFEEITFDTVRDYEAGVACTQTETYITVNVGDTEYYDVTTSVYSHSTYE